MAQNYGSMGGNAARSPRQLGSRGSFGIPGLQEEEEDADEHAMLLSGAESLPTVLLESDEEADYSHDPLHRAISASYAPISILNKPRRRRMVSETDLSKMRPFMAPPYLFPSTQTLSLMASMDDMGNDDEYGSSTSDSGIAEPVAKHSKQTDKGLPKLTSKQIVTIIILSFANFCSTVAFSCIAPFYPDEAQKKGMNVTQIGIVFGVFELVMFIFAPILGKYMCVIGSKFMFISGLFITAGTSVLFGFLIWLDTGPMFFYYSLAIRCVEAIGDAAFLTSSFAITAYCFPGRIATVVGILETFGGLGFTAGPAVGGLLFELGGYQLPFIVLGALLGVAALVSYFLLESPFDQEMKNTQGMMSLLKMPSILLLVLAVVVCAMSLAFIDPTLADHLDSFHLSPVLVGLMFLWCGGIYTITAPLWGYLIDRFNCAPSLMVFGAILSVVGMFFIGPAPFLGMEKSLVSIAAALVILGVAIGALYIPTFQACLDTVKENGFPDNFETYGCVSGLFQSAFSFGGFFGPTFGGFAVEAIGFEWTTTVIAGIHLLVAIPLIVHNVVLYRRRKNAKITTYPAMPVLSAPLLDSSDV